MKPKNVVGAIVLSLAMMNSIANPLLDAAANGDSSTIRELLRDDRYRHKLNVSEYKGDTPLVAAAKNGHLEALELLIAEGADINLSADDGWHSYGLTPIDAAVMFGRFDILTALIQAGADPTGDGKGLSPLRRAVDNDDHHAMVALLDAGVDPNVRTDSYDFNALHTAAVNGYSTATGMLLHAGADPNDRVLKTEDTALHLVSEANDVETAQVLFGFKADPDARNAKGLTPLHVAGTEEMIELLLDKDADREIQDLNGRPALNTDGPGKSPTPVCDQYAWKSESPTSCWLRLSTWRTCHVWLNEWPRYRLKDAFELIDDVDWSEGCDDGGADGYGTLALSGDVGDGRTLEYRMTGLLWKGKARGKWVENFEIHGGRLRVDHEEGVYVSGVREGIWMYEFKRGGQHACRRYRFDNDEGSDWGLTPPHVECAQPTSTAARSSPSRTTPSHRRARRAVSDGADAPAS